MSGKVGLTITGITGGIRRGVGTPGGYAKLFSYYSSHIFPENQEDFEKLVSLGRKKRMAMMCFEKDVEYCHRGVIAHEIKKRGFEVVHL